MGTLIENIINGVIATEGGYVNDPSDAGGETMYGITISEARKNGYTGPMAYLPKDTAYAIYLQKYIIAPKFDQVLYISEEIGTELIDTGVNMGQGVAATFLQRALNVFNQQERLYADVAVDGALGDKSILALKEYLRTRGKPAVVVMMRALNAQQGFRYIDITEKRKKNEDFAFGWFANRVT